LGLEIYLSKHAEGQFYESVTEQHTLGDDQRFQLSFLRRSLHDFRLDGVVRDQPEHENGFRLSDSVGSILGLEVHLRVLYRVDKSADEACFRYT
jgi:hypothetical protein